MMNSYTQNRDAITELTDILTEILKSKIKSRFSVKYDGRSDSIAVIMEVDYMQNNIVYFITKFSKRIKYGESLQAIANDAIKTLRKEVFKHYFT